MALVLYEDRLRCCFELIYVARFDSLGSNKRKDFRRSLIGHNVAQGKASSSSSDTFFFKDDLGSETFSRDSQGHVIGYTYHRADGQEIHVKKIK